MALYERNKPSLFEESIPVDQSAFELPDGYLFDEWLNEDAASMASGSVPFTEYQINLAVDANEKKEAKSRVAFKTESQIEILEDGFKWRKYGKKMVKNSPNPRNYFKCSVEGCSVKKRVERDGEDPRRTGLTFQPVAMVDQARAAQRRNKKQDSVLPKIRIRSI